MTKNIEILISDILHAIFKNNILFEILILMNSIDMFVIMCISTYIRNYDPQYSHKNVNGLELTLHKYVFKLSNCDIQKNLLKIFK